MNHLRIIFHVLFLVFFSACFDEEKGKETKLMKHSKDQIKIENDFPSINPVNGQELRIELRTYGCFISESQSISITKNGDRNYVVSQYRDKNCILSNKVLDSSFQIHLKAFIYDCRRLLKDSTVSVSITQIEKIIISDGLYFKEVDIGYSSSINPFKNLISAIYWHGKNRLSPY